MSNRGSKVQVALGFESWQVLIVRYAKIDSVKSIYVKLTRILLDVVD